MEEVLAGRGDNDLLMDWISQDKNSDALLELDGKALARVTGDRRVDLVPLSEVQKLTGYIRGGVTALGGKRDYPVYADETIELFAVVSISAGVRGTRILIAPADYLSVTHATVVAIAREKNPGS
jgi:Cys-tRNA(Pro)/Cys-tRNA(Cys) deacylase